MSIHSNVYNIVQVLSEDGDLHVPWFQRDYTWDEDNINELFEDIFEEYSWINIVNSARNKTPIRDYFLGAVMLCGPSDKRRMIFPRGMTAHLAFKFGEYIVFSESEPFLGFFAIDDLSVGFDLNDGGGYSITVDIDDGLNRAGIIKSGQ